MLKWDVYEYIFLGTKNQIITLEDDPVSNVI